MTHTRSMHELEGDFTEVEESGRPCRNCGGAMICQLWESSDGAYEDYKYECKDCGYTFWVEGADS